MEKQNSSSKDYAIDLRPIYLWYRENKRALPFRFSKDPYRIWVSEVMLQQTRMATILEPYQRFITRFPNMKSLANASEEEVLNYWQGLGYYSRARNLRKGVRQVLQEYKGTFPQDLDSVLSLSGVGPYIAAAILSICYGHKLSTLDANVKRVLARIYHICEASKNKYLEHISQSWLLQGMKIFNSGALAVSSGEHNQAIMEWGELVCTAKQARCFLCPMSSQCKSYQIGGEKEASRVPPVRKKSFIQLKLHFWLIVSANRKSVLLLKEDHSRFLRGLWSFPYVYRNLTNPEQNWSVPHFPTIFLQSSVKKRHIFPQKIKHSITNHKITGEVETIWLASGCKKFLSYLQTTGSDAFQREWLWVEWGKLQSYLVSSLGKKALSVYNMNS